MGLNKKKKVTQLNKIIEPEATEVADPSVQLVCPCMSSAAPCPARSLLGAAGGGNRAEQHPDPAGPTAADRGSLTPCQHPRAPETYP